jgi:hypothetical protein
MHGELEGRRNDTFVFICNLFNGAVSNRLYSIEELDEDE